MGYGPCVKDWVEWQVSKSELRIQNLWRDCFYDIPRSCPVYPDGVSHLRLVSAMHCL